MDQFEPLHHSFAHFVQTIRVGQQDGLVLVIPKLYHNLLLLEKLHLLLVAAAYNFAVSQLQEEELSNIHHLQYLKIKPIHLHKLSLLVDRQHVFESKCDHLGILRVGSKGELDALDLSDMVEPNAAACQHVGLQVIGDAEVVVLITDEHCRALFNGNVALVRFCLEVVDEDPLGRDYNEQIFEEADSHDFQVGLKVIDVFLHEEV